MVATGVILLAIGAVSWFAASTRGPVRVIVPELSPPAQSGKLEFEKNCAACHGENAAGGSAGPPLVHRVYDSRHHSDAAFALAVRRGVRAHHWTFGDMPPQPAVGDPELAQIIRYVRELQKANGID